jgi:uncharacterized protein YeaO (DUF488 family)
MRQEKTKLECKLSELQGSNEELKTKFSHLLERFQDYVSRNEEERAFVEQKATDMRAMEDKNLQQQLVIENLEAIADELRQELSEC